MIVDAHVHVLPPQLRARRDLVARDDAWFAACHQGERVIASADELLQAMDEDGVDRAICLGWPFAAAELRRETNRYLAGVQRRHADRLVAFGIVNPAAPTALDELRECADLGLRGVGELNCDAQGFRLDDPAIADAVGLSVEQDLVWTLHCSEPVGHAYAGKGSTTPDRVTAFALRHPALRLVCAHLGGGLPLFAHMPEVAALCRRLWFDTAAQPFLYEASVYRTLVDLCGADRLLLGSDYPLLRLPRYRRALTAAGLDAAAQALLLGGSALALLGERVG